MLEIFTHSYTNVDKYIYISAKDDYDDFEGK